MHIADWWLWFFHDFLAMILCLKNLPFFLLKKTFFRRLFIQNTSFSWKRNCVLGTRCVHDFILALSWRSSLVTFLICASHPKFLSHIKSLTSTSRVPVFFQSSKSTIKIWSEKMKIASFLIICLGCFGKFVEFYLKVSILISQLSKVGSSVAQVDIVAIVTTFISSIGQRFQCGFAAAGIPVLDPLFITSDNFYVGKIGNLSKFVFCLT